MFCYYIFMNKHSRNTISDRQLFSLYRSKCFIEDFPSRTIPVFYICKLVTSLVHLRKLVEHTPEIIRNARLSFYNFLDKEM